MDGKTVSRKNPKAVDLLGGVRSVWWKQFVEKVSSKRQVMDNEIGNTKNTYFKQGIPPETLTSPK